MPWNALRPFADTKPAESGRGFKAASTASLTQTNAASLTGCGVPVYLFCASLVVRDNPDEAIRYIMEARHATA